VGNPQERPRSLSPGRGFTFARSVSPLARSCLLVSGSRADFYDCMSSRTADPSLGPTPLPPLCFRCGLRVGGIRGRGGSILGRWAHLLRMRNPSKSLVKIFFIGALCMMTGCASKPFGEEDSLKMLKRSGDDVSKPHVAQYEFHFPTKVLADSAVARLRNAQMAIEVFEPDGSEWHCLVTKTITPDSTSLKRMNAAMNKIAKEYGGKFDGWGLRGNGTLNTGLEQTPATLTSGWLCALYTGS